MYNPLKKGLYWGRESV